MPQKTLSSVRVFDERIDQACGTCGRTSFDKSCADERHTPKKASPDQTDVWLREMYSLLSSYKGPVGPYRFTDICRHCDFHESKHINGRCLLIPSRFEGYVPTDVARQ